MLLQVIRKGLSQSNVGQATFVFDIIAHEGDSKIGSNEVTNLLPLFSIKYPYPCNRSASHSHSRVKVSTAFA
jgi:hypothetical protein